MPCNIIQCRWLSGRIAISSHIIRLEKIIVFQINWSIQTEMRWSFIINGRIRTIAISCNRDCFEQLKLLDYADFTANFSGSLILPITFQKKKLQQKRIPKWTHFRFFLCFIPHSFALYSFLHLVFCVFIFCIEPEILHYFLLNFLSFISFVKAHQLPVNHIHLLSNRAFCTIFSHCSNRKQFFFTFLFK